MGEAYRALDSLAGHFTDPRDLTVEVAGHTDAVGSDKDNQILSERRARTVATYLADHFHLSSAQLHVVGYGESQPVADNATDQGRQANRRVEIILMRRNDAGAGAGLWRFDDGQLALAIGRDGTVVGRYPNDNGRWFGQKRGRVISGYWVENDSGQTCKTEKDGSRHWGRLEVEINQDGDGFDGWWSYCDAEDHEGMLHGTRIR